MTKLNLINSLSKSAIKALTITGITIAIVELHKQDFSVGISASISWMLLIIAYKKIEK